MILTSPSNIEDIPTRVASRSTATHCTYEKPWSGAVLSFQWIQFPMSRVRCTQ